MGRTEEREEGLTVSAQWGVGRLLIMMSDDKGKRGEDDSDTAECRVQSAETTLDNAH